MQRMQRMRQCCYHHCSQMTAPNLIAMSAKHDPKEQKEERKTQGKKLRVAGGSLDDEPAPPLPRLGGEGRDKGTTSERHGHEEVANEEVRVEDDDGKEEEEEEAGDERKEMTEKA